MPRRAPKQTITLRVDPALIAEFRAVVPKGNFSAAVDEGVRWWVARERRLQKQGKTGVKPPKGRPVSPLTAATRALVEGLLANVAAMREDEEDEDEAAP
jgi:hypothetical protein